LRRERGVDRVRLGLRVTYFRLPSPLDRAGASMQELAAHWGVHRTTVTAQLRQAASGSAVSWERLSSGSTTPR
jgi:hypothetical protein